MEENGVETRPIISGNFAKQPAAKKYNLVNKDKFPNTDEVYNNSFFIGLPTISIKSKTLKLLEKIFEKSFKQ